MKKEKKQGFVLLETLVVTIFVSSVLLFLFVQFNSLSKKYEESYDYNNVEKIYSLRNISNLILSDQSLYEKIGSDKNDYINLSDCSLFTDVNYCKKVFNYEIIDKIYVTKNTFEKEIFMDTDDDFYNFISKISPKGVEKYRLIAKFTDGEFATIRFGENNE